MVFSVFIIYRNLSFSLKKIEKSNIVHISYIK